MSGRPRLSGNRQSLTFTKDTAGIAKNISLQPYVLGAQFADFTSVAPVVPVFAEYHNYLDFSSQGTAPILT